MNKIAKYSAIVGIASSLLISGPANAHAAGGSQASTAVKEQQTTQQEGNLGEQNTMSVSWYQNSAEAKALYLQGYNTAKDNLDKQLKHYHGKGKGKKQPAIVLDIDETVLDNSPYQAYASLNNTTFPKGWHEWVMAAKAKPVYGAKDFLNYANKKGVAIYYVSDRDKDTELEATSKNLKAQGLPQNDKSHILLKGKNDKNKESRRDYVKKNHNLLMLFGDNLLDFEDPKAQTAQSRTDLVNEKKEEFGRKYIIFPNPMYGSWESTLYNNDYSKSSQEKDQLRKASLTTFDPATGEVKQAQQ
ncbi:5'-nucleotidase, lipoprotein e(P4) family [Staphylococcus carnosus]|uniref:5'-nucleotidase, lipoprotein e(P4) family n=1 Tax=Staphylococcus carnosus (strain TM300) TaxID=396513 RepID=B9DL66_STACT|nr:5'-nucleotidase, lipoprotein e(P4) family [Staphylococcus carnosus]QPT04903.1 5'-nucleotidase, lipoprotein e(P4) family [Staphylococcus carnosus]UQA67628.1 5'-nucleotidase, lipoprotein e(P4) family [Staphylococcus carnosus]UTB77545.1 5'-nucleotidase, lipoprotein e(P4) family [Staphylococcus carnosus]UTB87089.1 5'-nucleotidase, lipoprotein e(P4) family [Staphylococcus carnosus]UTB89439.1 5'-nucleotidase, lipoprotein e(P4) family [Staphylococcus carnosus]